MKQQQSKSEINFTSKEKNMSEIFDSKPEDNGKAYNVEHSIPHSNNEISKPKPKYDFMEIKEEDEIRIVTKDSLEGVNKVTSKINSAKFTKNNLENFDFENKNNFEYYFYLIKNFSDTNKDFTSVINDNFSLKKFLLIKNTNDYVNMLDSPKSVKALRKLNISHKELIKIPFENYMNIYDEYKTKTKEFLRGQYQEHERKRYEKIQECKFERKNLIELEEHIEKDFYKADDYHGNYNSKFDLVGKTNKYNDSSINEKSNYEGGLFIRKNAKSNNRTSLENSDIQKTTNNMIKEFENIEKSKGNSSIGANNNNTNFINQITKKNSSKFDLRNLEENLYKKENEEENKKTENKDSDNFLSSKLNLPKNISEKKFENLGSSIGNNLNFFNNSNNNSIQNKTQIEKNIYITTSDNNHMTKEDFVLQKIMMYKNENPISLKEGNFNFDKKFEFLKKEEKLLEEQSKQKKINEEDMKKYIIFHSKKIENEINLELGNLQEKYLNKSGSRPLTSRAKSSKIREYDMEKDKEFIDKLRKSREGKEIIKEVKEEDVIYNEKIKSELQNLYNENFKRKFQSELIHRNTGKNFNNIVKNLEYKIKTINKIEGDFNNNNNNNNNQNSRITSGKTIKTFSEVEFNSENEIKNLLKPKQNIETLKEKLTLREIELKKRLLRRENSKMDKILDNKLKREDKLAKIKVDDKEKEINKIKNYLQKNEKEENKMKNMKSRPTTSNIYSTRQNIINEANSKVTTRINSCCKETLNKNTNIPNLNENKTENFFPKENEDEYNNNFDLDGFYIDKLHNRLINKNNIFEKKHIDIDKYLKEFRMRNPEKFENAGPSAINLIFGNHNTYRLTSRENSPMLSNKFTDMVNASNKTEFNTKELKSKLFSKKDSKITDIDMNYYRNFTESNVNNFNQNGDIKQIQREKNCELIIKEYRINLNKKLEEKILEEKEKEKNRVERLRYITDFDERKRIELLNSDERNKASENLIEFNE